MSTEKANDLPEQPVKQKSSGKISQQPDQQPNLRTRRLQMRPLTEKDLPDLREILQDPEVMTAYEGPFDEALVQDWLNRQLMRYTQHPFGLWAVVLKETGEMIGQCGLTMQPWNNEEVLEVGYLFKKDFWHQGYATEAAAACLDYAFETLKAPEVSAIIRDTNTNSINVAKRLNMKPRDHFVKHYRNTDMPHTRYSIRKA